jgi:hypothetical protein
LFFSPHIADGSTTSASCAVSRPANLAHQQVHAVHRAGCGGGLIALMDALIETRRRL